MGVKLRRFMMKKLKEKLSFKIGTKDEAYWLGIKEKTENEIKALENMLKFNRAILEMSKTKIKKAK